MNNKKDLKIFDFEQDFLKKAIIEYEEIVFRLGNITKLMQDIYNNVKALNDKETLQEYTMMINFFKREKQKYNELTNKINEIIVEQDTNNKLN